ncbi:uncharacterized protein LOC131321157 [Rhododendron vialii]|uniref:uncharacterized protein LOC131321157 n=1 Tax=Rhododendron vialii TaxID=182163 RepID=UPI00265E9D09|nr:uncharacterized protein LOC131321157 [Rhododendron vialii]
MTRQTPLTPLPLGEFAYNNRYQASIGMALYEAVYGQPCRSPIYWTEVREDALFGSELVRETTEKVKVIRERLLTSQNRQKSYADKRVRPLTFSMGDHVFLKIKLRRGIIRVGKKGKLSPRYIGPFEILEQIGEISLLYRRRSPSSRLFHVSMLRKYMAHPTHVLNWEEVTLDEDTTFEDQLMEIQYHGEKVTRGRTIKLVRVLWRHCGLEESTW